MRKKDSKPGARKKKTKTSARRQGGQPGNKNAEKHGFYSRHFTVDEATRLEGSDRLSIEAEIDLIRVCIDRLTEQLDFEPVYLMGKDQNGAPIQTQQRDGHYLQQLNTLSVMSQSLATLQRTHYLTRGKGGSVEKDIMEALEELRIELGI